MSTPDTLHRRQRLARAACLLLASLATTPASGEVAQQPQGKGSSMSVQGGGSIRDATLAQWIGTALLKDGKRNVREAAFLFNSCFGGGMLDDLGKAMGNQIPWVGGSASRHDQYAIGQNSPAENATLKRPEAFVDDRPMGFWTRALVPLLEPKDATVFGAVRDAAAADEVGRAAQRAVDIDKAMKQAKVAVPFGTATIRPEDVQFQQGNGGDAMKVNCDNCNKRYVVIWAGNTDRLRAFNDVAGMIDVLRTNWGGDPANVEIKVFYGNGRDKVTGPLAPPQAENLLPAEWGARPAERRRLQDYRGKA